MNNPRRSEFTYVTYIRTTAAKLWWALTDRDFVKQYWFGMQIECDWKIGSPLTLLYPDGRINSSGKILDSAPATRLVFTWRHESNEERMAEGDTRCTIVLEPAGSAVKLSLAHDVDRADSKFIAAASDSWPKVLSNLKSLLETGQVALVDP